MKLVGKDFQCRILQNVLPWNDPALLSSASIRPSWLSYHASHVSLSLTLPALSFSTLSHGPSLPSDRALRLLVTGRLPRPPRGDDSNRKLSITVMRKGMEGIEGWMDDGWFLLCAVMEKRNNPHLCLCCSAGACHCTPPPYCRYASYKTDRKINK